jgi:hypothetical protein
VYELTLPRDWVVKAAPFLKLLAGTLRLVVPVARLPLPIRASRSRLDLGQKTVDSVLKGGKAREAGWPAETPPIWNRAKRSGAKARLCDNSTRG